MVEAIVECIFKDCLRECCIFLCGSLCEVLCQVCCVYCCCCIIQKKEESKQQNNKEDYRILEESEQKQEIQQHQSQFSQPSMVQDSLYTFQQQPGNQIDIQQPQMQTLQEEQKMSDLHEILNRQYEESNQQLLKGN